jgi:hypothetical protein
VIREGLIMNIGIPEELLFPTIEELEERTAKDLADKWRPCKRPGKKERNAIKREKETAKLKAIASEFDSSRQSATNSLSSIFIQIDQPKFSLATVNANSSNSINIQPTLRVSFEKTKENGVVTSLISPSSGNASRKRGRPPKLSTL